MSVFKNPTRGGMAMAARMGGGLAAKVEGEHPCETGGEDEHDDDGGRPGPTPAAVRTDFRAGGDRVLAGLADHGL